MRLLLVVTSLLMAITLTAGEAMRVDGVPVYGRVRDVFPSDIHYSIADGRLGKPLELEVISSREMHAYYEPREVGWTRVRLFPSVPLYHGKHVIWDAAPLYVEDPVVLHLIRAADEVYIFPVTKPLKPRRDKFLRLLDQTARYRLVHLLSPERNWHRGNATIAFVGGGPSRNVGLLFRHGRSELVLFFPRSVISSAGWVDGTINGQHTSGILEERSAQQFDQWVQRYAQPELTAK